MSEVYLVKYFGKHNIGFNNATFEKKEDAEEVFEKVVKQLEGSVKVEVSVADISDDLKISFATVLSHDNTIDVLQVNLETLKVIDLEEVKGKKE